MRNKLQRYIWLLFTLLLVSNSSHIYSQTTPQAFKIRGTGLNHNAKSELKIGSNTIYLHGGRGLRLTVLQKSDLTIILDQSFDTYGVATHSNNLASALNQITNDQIGVLTSYDAWEANVTEDLDAAFLRLGLTKGLATENTGSRRSYAAIFEGGSNGTTTGKVVEVSYENTANQPFAEIRGFFYAGSFLATGSNTNALMRPQGDNTEVIVDYAGNVGIGTNSPDYKLDVEGTIRTRELKVDMEGADFVFEDDYELRSLNEVEEFINNNKHLPDIAPAAEMEENGVNQSEMNQKLLQKIEELTLYLIELKKENLIQNNKIQTLENSLK